MKSVDILKTYSENNLPPFVTKLFNKLYDVNVFPQTGTHMLLYHCSKRWAHKPRQLQGNFLIKHDQERLFAVFKPFWIRGFTSTIATLASLFFYFLFLMFFIERSLFVVYSSHAPQELLEFCGFMHLSAVSFFSVFSRVLWSAVLQ